MPPDLLPQLGRYFAILTAFETRLDGGTQPTAQAGQPALQTRIAHAQCLAAKNLGIQRQPAVRRVSTTAPTRWSRPRSKLAARRLTDRPSRAAKPRLTPPC